MFFKKRKPIIFLHGILGSMGEGIFKGSGELHFGISDIVYRPMINNLRSLGYREGKDLFICYYDWTKGNMESVKNYLIPTIKEAKLKSQSSKVDIIGHSMGGIVARSYAQSNLYANDIDKLIMIGTPNAGSANAYYFWSGGEMVFKESYQNVLYRLVKSGFVWYIKHNYKKDIDMEFIRDKIPSVKELLPSYEYGDYLINSNDSSSISIEDMSIKNEFLNLLNSNKRILKDRGIKTYTIVGTGVDTTEKIEVTEQKLEREKWLDGIPLENIKTYSGDGTVTCNSIKAVDGEVIYINSDHTGILSECRDELSKILNIKRRNIFIESEEEKVDKIYSITAKDIGEISIDGYINSQNIVSKSATKDSCWIIIKANKNDDINLNLKQLSCNSKIKIYKGDIETGIIQKENIDINKIDTKSIKL